MKNEVLYSKKYPNRQEEYMAVLEQPEDQFAEPLPTYDEMLAALSENITCKALPERKEKSEKFIQSAIRIAEIYEYDIEVRALDTNIQVNISFDGSRALGLLNRLIGAADEVDLFLGGSERDVTLSLDYYTHAVYLRGRQIHP